MYYELILIYNLFTIVVLMQNAASEMTRIHGTKTMKGNNVRVVQFNLTCEIAIVYNCVKKSTLLNSNWILWKNNSVEPL
jgi:hypothetical protein